MIFQDLDLKKEKFRKLNLVGRENTLFLNNDSNSEIMQHYMKDYVSNFNEEKFRLSFESKQDYCDRYGIEYKFYVVPDKSIVCKDYLPITPSFINRNFDIIKDLTIDFTSKLTPQDYFKSDSHINFIGGMKLASEIMHDIRGQVSSSMYMEAIKENMYKKKIYRKGDLYDFKIPDESKNELTYIYWFTSFVLYSRMTFSKPVPDEFKKVGFRKSKYFQNDLSLTDMRCLALHDSSFNHVVQPLNVFFRNIFCYWDHWMFNKKLINWYEPDIIIEIRTERFLENMSYELV